MTKPPLIHLPKDPFLLEVRQRQLNEGFISQQAARFKVTAKGARNELLGDSKPRNN